jgi:23S rRNA-/tRNA-specific pseudouridylate synthase
MSAAQVLFRDDDFLVVNKPSGLATTSPDGRNCLAWDVAKKLDRGAKHAHPSSRLDREVTGIVIFARTDRGIQHLLEARKAERYRRTYLALVTPAPAASEGRWTWRIGIDPRDRRLRVALDEGQAGERVQDAASRFEVLTSSAGVALLAVRPETGRTHQIRVHAKASGSPIVGDTSYGGVGRVTLSDGRVIHAPRVMLHCRQVIIPKITPLSVEASSDEAHAFLADVPDDFRDVWRRAGGEPSVLDVSLLERAPA